MTEAPERMLPLYEAKMIHQFDHRWATYEGGRARDMTGTEKSDPDHFGLPRYWVGEDQVESVLAERWDRDWILGWRDIARATDVRTTIAAITGSGDSPEGGTLLMLPESGSASAPCLVAALNSLAFDFCARQKVGGTHLKFFTMRQLPVPTPEAMSIPTSWDPESSHDEWITLRVLELTYTDWDMQPFAEDLDDTGAPFVWDPERRFLLRAELDAAFFRLYGVVRADVDYILDTFPIVRRKDEEAHGEYRTKRVILEVFDAMQRATDTGVAYQSVLDPAPSLGRRHPLRNR
ncbi:hypothetical protein [Williamsia sp. D3]|uniref:hypothetical protein n=1 Tax=Williamsia sp. D3 TaxID=1313067 RepID=UPI0003D2BB05|nr:hypothetical protein [Williamsia sp. D3]ETD31759.1 type II restriction endonuclease [Williamsia sp. D3]